MAGGRFGQVLLGSGTNPASTVENWNLTDTKTGDSYVASNTLGGTQRGGGVRSWSGSFAGRGGTPPVLPNQEFLFYGYTYPTTGTELNDGIVYSGQAICSQVVINWNWQANQIYSWTADFQGGNSTGVGLTIGEQATELDTSIPPVESPCNNHILYASTDIKPATTIPNTVSAALTITAALSTESNSSNFSGADCWTRSLAGPIDWNLSIPQEDFDRADPANPALGSIIRLDVFTNPSDFWDLQFGRVEDYSNLVVNRNGDTIARTINIAMCAHNGTRGGRIVVPGGDDTNPWWGEAATP